MNSFMLGLFVGIIVWQTVGLLICIVNHYLNNDDTDSLIAVLFVWTIIGWVLNKTLFKAYKRAKLRYLNKHYLMCAIYLNEKQYEWEPLAIKISDVSKYKTEQTGLHIRIIKNFNFKSYPYQYITKPKKAIAKKCIKQLLK